MRNRLWIFLAALILASTMLTGCLPGDGSATQDKPAGFLWGIWHGWIAPISLIIEAFKGNIRIYEPFNSGFWYDLGFYVAILGGFGGVSLVRRRGSRDDR